MTTSDALAQFMTIFYDVVIAFAAIVVPLLVLTWAIRLTAELIRGGK